MRPQIADKQAYFMRQLMQSQCRHTPAKTDGRRKKNEIRKSPVEMYPITQSEGITNKVFS